MSDTNQAFTMELACCGMVIENEIEQGATQAEIANTYAMALVSSWPTDWKRVNEAIVKRWPKGLNRIKTWAWKIAESKGQWHCDKKMNDCEKH